MTRKDYVLIADTIAQFSRDIAIDGDSEYLTDRARAIRDGERDALVTLAHRLADRLREDNYRFDQRRFMDACQLDAERLA
jgi:hypothetical protein